MDMFVIQGGNRLSGCASISGAKNAALPIMAASIMTSGRLMLENIPRLVDINSMSILLESLGVSAHGPVENQMVLQSVDHSKFWADYELVRKMRASFCVLGPLLSKRKMACVSLPGGCQIGDRPVDLHLKGLAALGAQINIERGYVVARTSQLRGNTIDLSGPFGSTVTGTCNVMSAATLAKGTTVINHAAIEPEVVDLGNCLKKMGAKIHGLGTSQIVIDGVKELDGTIHHVIPDRIEAATLMIATAITNGDVVLKNVPVELLSSVISKLIEAGVCIESVNAACNDDSQLQFHPEMGLVNYQQAVDYHHLNLNKHHSLRITCKGELQPVTCLAEPYPGIPTDIQAQLTSMLAIAKGTSAVRDQVFGDRFMHIMELNRMGANISKAGNAAMIKGSKYLTGAIVMASDLRASAALVLAGLVARGETVIRRIYHLDRGYEQLERKLQLLGANVRRVQDIPENIPASLRSLSLELPEISSEKHNKQPETKYRIDLPHSNTEVEQASLKLQHENLNKLNPPQNQQP